MKITLWIPTQHKGNPEIIMDMAERPVLTFNSFVAFLKF
jgi:hypothetical protein